MENLLKFKGSSDTNVIVGDVSILTCGCLVSESYFLSRLTSNSNGVTSNCPDCQTQNVSILSEVSPLRDLFSIIQEIHQKNNSRHRSSSKKSVRRPSELTESKNPDSMDFISLFYKFAKEEKAGLESNEVVPITNKNHSDKPTETPSLMEYSLTSNPNKDQLPESLLNFTVDNDKANFENKLLTSLSEEREYNFSKCFPFNRKLSVFPTQQLKFNLSSITKGGMIKKNTTFINSHIHTSLDCKTNNEITRFVLITNKKWELYESIISPDDTPLIKPTMICCGKLTGEYGKDFSNLKNGYNPNEIVVKNDFTGTSNNSTNNTTNSEYIKKKLNSWDQVFCKLSKNYLVISGTKGVMRVFNVSPTSPPGELGKPMYTYLTNFPIRCISISGNESLVACGITAKERLSGKEQPFVILHKLIPSLKIERALETVDPISITIPYRDPIKIINFNSSSTHMLCCTAWESRYLIIRLRSKSSDDYRKPRLIWVDVRSEKSLRRKMESNDGGSDNDSDGNETMDDEGITDLQFGLLFPNTLVLSSCSLKNRPTLVIRLDGELIDSKNSGNLFTGHNNSLDNYSQVMSCLSSNHSKNEDDQNPQISNIGGSETIMKIPEIGSSIHRIALLPRGDGMAFVDKEGHIFLVSTPNFQLHPTSSTKNIVVQLGEVANAARYNESASVKFSADGSRVYTIDRKGIFQVYDFGKGIPGHDVDVVKCKIINV